MTTAEAEAEEKRQTTDELIGVTVGGRFQISEQIARGGMACVYFATQQPLNRPVAIKVLRADGGAEDEESFRRRFIREAHMLSQLQHPNIVTLLDYGQISDLPGSHYFMAMEYLRGETLAKRLRKRGSLSIVETLRLARQIGRGLREAHRRGFVHRDLKPSNIMLVPEDDQNDIVKLVDFGIGKVVTPLNPELSHRDEDDMTRMGLLLGSPRHMAPEQIRGEAIEPRTDLYGLGVILFQALSGHLPFDGRTEVEILVLHCTSPAPKLSETYPDRYIPQSLSDLVDLLLRKQASARPTIYEFLLKLADVEDEVFGALGLTGPSMTLPPSMRLPVPRAEPFHEQRTVADQAPSTQLLELIEAPERERASGSFASAISSVPRRRRRLGIAMFLLLSSVALAAVFWQSRRESPATASLPSVPPPPVSSGPLPREPSSFVLSVESLPAKATVREGGAVLGKTPLKIEIERPSVLAAPRRFSVEHDGYVPRVLEQGDSSQDVSFVAKLEPARAAAPAPVAGGARNSTTRALPTKSAPSASAKAPSSSVLLEIRTRR